MVKRLNDKCLMYIIMRMFLSAGKTVTRKSLHRQHRALSRSLLCPALRALRRDSPGLLAQLAGRAHGASAGSSDEVAAALVAARRLAAEIERACQGLEMLAERRRERLRELAREQALEHETDEVGDKNKYGFRIVFLRLS